MKMAGSLHPPFSPFLPEENEKTGRARSKRVKEVGTRRTGARLNDRRSRNDFSARNWFEREFWRASNRPAPLFAGATLAKESAGRKPKAPSLRELSPPEAVTEGVPPRSTALGKLPPSRLRRATSLKEGGFFDNPGQTQAAPFPSSSRSTPGLWDGRWLDRALEAG